MSPSVSKEPELAFVHLQRVEIDLDKNQGDFVIGNDDDNDDSGILAVSVPTEVMDGGSASDKNDTAVLLLQLVVGKKSGGIFSNWYTISQICNDLKLDRNAILQHAAMEGKNHNSSHAALSPEVNHLVGLLASCCSSSSQIYGTREDAISIPQRHLTFDMRGNNNGKGSLQATIKERTKTGLVRLLWSTMLSCNIDSKAGSIGDLTFRLLQRHEDIVGQLATFEKKYSQLERDRDGWKDTAEKLEGQWEEEKSTLFQNFCDLYAGKQDHEKQKFEGLLRENERLKVELAEATTNRRTNNITRQHELPKILKNLPNDGDRELYDTEMVNRLAEGKRFNESKRRNHLTGAMEYFDADAALEDVVQSAAQQQPAPAKKARRTKETEKHSSAPIKQKELKVKSVPAAKKKATLTATLGKDFSDSETGSDNDFVDKAMEAKIMADLEALQKT